MRASAHRWIALSSLVALGSAPGAFAQGMSEYGGLMGGGAHLGPNASSALTRGYGAGAGASQKSGTLNAPNKRPHVDAETADAYAALSNKTYLEAQKKEKAGALNEAYTMYGQSADLRIRIWGDRDPAVLSIFNLQGKIAMKQGKLPQAEATYRKMLAIVGRKNGPGSPEAKPIVSTLASILDKEKKYSDAAEMYKQLVALEQRTAGDAGPEVLKNRLKLVNSYLQAKQVTQAEVSLREMIAAVDSMPAPDSVALVKALQTYSDLLKQEGRGDEASPLDARIASLGGSPSSAPPAPPAGTAPAAPPTPAATTAPPTPPAGKAPAVPPASTAPAAPPATTAPAAPPASTAPSAPPASTAPATPPAPPTGTTPPAPPPSK